jgi:hypothetical protein
MVVDASLRYAMKLLYTLYQQVATLRINPLDFVPSLNGQDRDDTPPPQKDGREERDIFQEERLW